MVQEGVSQEGNPQGSSDLNLNLAPAAQGLKLDNHNYTRQNCAAMLLANHASTPKALALAVIILVNPTEENLEAFQARYNRRGSTFLPSNSVVTTSAEMEAEKRDGKRICIFAFPRGHVSEVLVTVIGMAQ